MSKQSALDTLIELATTASDEAAQRLGKAIAAADNADQKLSLLLQYRDEYGERFKQSLKAGLSAAGYHNFRNFMAKLDEAIDSQHQLVDAARGTVDFERGQWQASERKRLSFDTLAARAEKAAEQRDNKRDQKLMDEHAMRTPLFKR